MSLGGDVCVMTLFLCSRCVWMCVLRGKLHVNLEDLTTFADAKLDKDVIVLELLRVFVKVNSRDEMRRRNCGIKRRVC